MTHRPRPTRRLNAARTLASALALACGVAAHAQPAFSDAALARAEAEVRAAFDSDNPILRANAVEAAAHLVERKHPMLALALQDDAPAVRFAALLVAGEQRLESFGGAAERLQADDDPSVRAAAIYAAQRLNRAANVSNLARLAMSGDPSVRGNAYLVLGRLGDRSALNMLDEIGHIPLAHGTNSTHAEIVSVQYADALARLGNTEEGLQTIRAAMFAQDPELSVFATTLCGDLGDRSFAPALVSMLDIYTERTADRPPELPIAAAVSLAKLGNPAGLELLLDVSGRETGSWPTESGRDVTFDTDSWQAMAAFGLGRLNDPRARAALVELLEDDNAYVRIAAAAAVLRAANG